MEKENYINNFQSNIATITSIEIYSEDTNYIDLIVKENEIKVSA
jgi:hypothetical protein